MHLLPLPLVTGTLGVPEGESPHGNHGSGNSMVASAVLDRVSTDSVSLHIVVCVFSSIFSLAVARPACALSRPVPEAQSP